jgi:hypothetical protein
MVNKILADAFKIIFTLLIVQNVLGINRLNDHIEHYEPLSYSNDQVQNQHSRHKRSLPQDNHEVEIFFTAHGRDFPLRLTSDPSVFHPDYTVVGQSDESLDHLDHTHYHGRLEGTYSTARYKSSTITHHVSHVAQASRGATCPAPSATACSTVRS